MTRRRTSQHGRGQPAKLGAPRDQHRAHSFEGKPAPHGKARSRGDAARRGQLANPAKQQVVVRRAPAPRTESPVQSGPIAPPRVGEWLWTTREGAERDVVDEFTLLGQRDARVVSPALVASAKAPSKEGRLALTFARQGFPIGTIAEGDTPGAIADALARWATQGPGGALASAATYALHVWVPDSTAANPLGSRARELEELVLSRLEPSNATRVDTRDIGPASIPFVQICLASERRAFAGVLASNRALSLAPGGRLRTHVGGDHPSRAARKIAEALAWLELTPEAGELCVDLGAAPGGWTWFLLERGARVIAVDPAKLRPDLLRRRGLTYVGKSAFEYAPEEPVDWLFCDMAWRPLEVAQMLGRWARQRDATLLVSNFKLPMKRKVEMVDAIRCTLETSGWRAIRTRQLYHDRDEITLTARLG